MTRISEQTLRKAFAQAIDRIFACYQRFPWEKEEAYAIWLTQTYYLVTHTTRLLGVAASLFGPDQEAFHRASLKGLREENGHDLLAKKDLEVLGYELESLPELPFTVATYAHQYYRVHHTGPISLWGYSLMVEGLASLKGKDIHARVESIYGKRAVNFMRVHARVDHGHFEAGLKELKGLSGEQIEGVLANLRASEPIFCQMLTGMQDYVEIRGRKKSAA